MFKPTNSLKKEIENKNYKAIRIRITNLCFVKRKGIPTFKSALDYCYKELGNDLYESYDNKKLISDEDKNFTEDDFALAVAELKYNFCKERIDDVYKLSMIVYKDSNTIEEDSNNNNNNWFKRKMNSLKKVFDSIVNKVKRFGQRVKNYFDRQAEKNTIVGRLYSMFKSLAHRIQSALSKLINICKNAINGKGNDQVKQKIQQGIEQTDKGLSQLDDIATKLDDEIKD